MSYDQMSQLITEINKLNNTLDSRVSAIEQEQKRLKETNVVTKTGNVPAEEQKAVDTINTEISAKIAEYKLLVQEQKELALAMQRPGYAGKNGKPEKSAETKAFERAIRMKGDENLTLEERKLISFGFMDTNNMAPEKKVMVSAAADLGGFFAGTDISDKFIQKLFLISPVRQYADVQTIGGEKLIIPSEGGTDTNVFWSDEQTGFQASPDPNLGMIEIYAREMNGYLKLSNQNLEDSTFDIEGFIMKRLTRQFAQKEGQAFLTGNGYARPEGILTNASVGVVTGSVSTKVSPDDIVQTMHSIKSGYRKTSNFYMANRTIGVLRLFKDTQAKPLWQPYGTEFVETIFGRPIVEMPDMVEPPLGSTTYTTGQQPIFFGDLSQGYQIVDRVGLTFQTLKELFAIQNQVAYLARMRVGGKVVLPEALIKLQVS